MPSINILCSSALPFVPTKFQIDADEHDTVLVVKKRLCLKLVQLQREGSVETSTESYNREQEHLGNTDNLKLIFGGKILPDANELPNLAATNPTFHLHLLPISLDKKLSIIERFRRGSKSEGTASEASGASNGSSQAEKEMYNVRLLSNQAQPTIHYNVQQQSLYNMDGEASLADLKHLLIHALGNDTAVKSLDLAIQRKFVVFNSKGQDFSEDSMKVKDINSFGRPPHSQGTNVVIFYRFVLGEFEQYQLEEDAVEEETPIQSNNPFKQEVKSMVEPTESATEDDLIQFDRETAAASVASSSTFPSNPLAGAFTAQLNLDEDKGKEVDDEGDVEMVEEVPAPVEVSAPTPTIKHILIKDTSLGDFRLNPAEVKTGSCTESEWVAISPREMYRLKRMYREFGNPETEVKRRKSGEFTRSPGEAVTTGRDLDHQHEATNSSAPSSAPSSSNLASGSSGASSSGAPSSSAAASSNGAPNSSSSAASDSAASSHSHSHSHPHGHIHNIPDTANSTDTEAEVPRSTQPSTGAAPSPANTTPASDQYRQFQQFLRWADTQHEDHAEPAEFDYRQFQQFLQWGQVQPPTQPPLVDFSFRLRISPPPWNIRQRIREMIPPRNELRQRAVVAVRQLGDVLVFLLQLFVFYIMVLGRINNDYMFYASCGLTVVIFVGYRFRHHLERFRPASFNVGSEELSRVAQIFPAVNYDQEDTTAGNNEAVREVLENPDNRHARGVRIGAAFFGSMIPAVHSRWLADNRQRRTQLDALIRQREREGQENTTEEGQNGQTNEEETNRAEQNE
ncbi:hypothetical protein CJU89_0069 [Yarrowia sp. B02]|nr:hypothetical protein CJU89_0069 [Yarrowia sp. B02]